jgi:hypothetical protein
MREYQYTVEIGSNGSVVGEAWTPTDPRTDQQRFSHTITAFVCEVQNAFATGLTNDSFRIQVQDISVTAYNARPHLTGSSGERRRSHQSSDTPVDFYSH